MKKTLYYILSVLFFIIALWGVTYTADWAGYEMSFENELERKDLAFGFIGKLLGNFGYYDYQSVFRAHVILMGVLFPAFILRWQKKPLIISALFIVLFYVPLANQIRYYVAFPLALLALQALICDKNKFLFLFFFIIAFAFHSSILFFIIVVCFYNYILVKRKNLVVDILMVNIFMGFVFFFGLKYLIAIVGDFSVYLTADNQVSTLAGGVYSAFPYMIAVALVIYIHNRIKEKYPLLLTDKSYMFLFVLCTATSLLFTISFKTQIVRHRFINPIFLIWMIYFVFVAMNVKSKYLKRLSYSSIVTVIVLIVLWQTIVPYYLGISKTIIDQDLILTLNSIQFE